MKPFLALKAALLPAIPKGSHMSIYDDQQTCFTGLIKFLRDGEGGQFK